MDASVRQADVAAIVDAQRASGDAATAGRFSRMRTGGTVSPGKAVVVDDLESGTFVSPTNGLPLPYRLFVPAGYDPSRKYRLLLVLHGSGERGADNRKQADGIMLSWVQPALQNETPTIVIFPQCPADQRWLNVSDISSGSYNADGTSASRPLVAALDLVAAVAQSLAVDRSRILVTGVSLGGMGTWDALFRRPELFAGAMPVCGIGDPSQVASMAKVAVWAYHGSDDGTVPVAGSRMMIAAAKKLGLSWRYTEVAGVGHDVWNVAYKDQTAMKWLLGQRRANP